MSRKHNKSVHSVMYVCSRFGGSEHLFRNLDQLDPQLVVHASSSVICQSKQSSDLLLNCEFFSM